MTTKHDIVVERVKRDKRNEPHRDLIRCQMIDITGGNDPAVSGRPGYVWVRSINTGGVFQCFNPNVQRRVGLQVLVGPDPQISNRKLVMSVDWSIVATHPDYGVEPYLPNHAASHEWPEFLPGPDAVSVYPRSMTQLRTYAGAGLTVSVQAYRYVLSGVVVEFTGESSVSIAIPDNAYEHMYVLVYLDTDTNTVQTAVGTPVVKIVDPDKPACPVGGIPSAYVVVAGDDTGIAEHMIYDARTPYMPVSWQDSIISKILTDDNGDVVSDDNGDVMLED